MDLKPESVTPSKVYAEGKYVPKVEMMFSSELKRLTDFTERFAFFTLGLPYLYGNFCDVVLWDYLGQQKDNVILYYAQFRYPVFRMLTSPDADRSWNHTLFAVEKQHWESFSNHVSSSVLRDEHGNIFSFFCEDILIGDPLYEDRNLSIPHGSNHAKMFVGAFGVDTSEHRIRLCDVAGAGRLPFAIKQSKKNTELTGEYIRGVLGE